MITDDNNIYDNMIELNVKKYHNIIFVQSFTWA